MQPNNYYGFGMSPAQQSQSQPQTPAMNGAKKHNGLVPVVILLIIIILGLGGYIIFDKFILKKAPEVIVEESSTSIAEPISKIEIPTDGEEHDEELAKILVSRTFTADAAHRQTISFENNTQYSYSYFKDPTSDFRKVLPSTNHGKFTIKGNSIGLESGDVFTVTNDYLVKSIGSLSANENTVYFDVQQVKTAFTGIDAALNTYVNNQSKVTKDSIATERTAIDFGSIICKTGDNHLTNADNYYCNVDYIIYANKDSADKAIEESKKLLENNGSKEEKILYKDFTAYCKYNTGAAEFSKDGTCNEDYSLRVNANIIVRINDGEYRIIGLFH